MMDSFEAQKKKKNGKKGTYEEKWNKNELKIRKKEKKKRNLKNSTIIILNKLKYKK